MGGDGALRGRLVRQPRAASTDTAYARTAGAHPPGRHHRDRLNRPARPTRFDLDRDWLAAPVAALRDLLAGANAAVLCTPEDAGLLSGASKMLWTGPGSTVSSDEPVFWINVAADARRGEGGLAELATELGPVQAPAPSACTDVPTPSTTTPWTLTS